MRLESKMKTNGRHYMKQIAAIATAKEEAENIRYQRQALKQHWDNEIIKLCKQGLSVDEIYNKIRK